MSDSDDLPPPPDDGGFPTPSLPRSQDELTRSYFASPPDGITATFAGGDGPQPAAPDETRDYAGPDAAGPAAIPGYDILNELGRGGMGVVYKARQLGLNRFVALKVIRGDVPREPDGSVTRRWRDRFEQEAKSLAQLNHPNIVQIHDAGEAGGQPYLVMEYVAGGALDARLGPTTLPPPRAAAEMARNLARAVQTAHDHKVVHRDLKPANVLVTPDGVLKIADFGLAKLLGDAADGVQRESVAGTPGYMAPEQVRGEPVAPAVDVYALGAILYKLLVNRPPFSADSRARVLQLVCGSIPIAPRLLQPSVPGDLEAICLKCLEKEPGRRYASAADLADDLDRFLDGRPTIARPPRWLARRWMWAKRRPAAAALAGVGGVLVAALAVIGVVVASNRYLDLDRQRAEAERDRETAERRAAEAQAAASDFIAQTYAAEQLSAPRDVGTEPGWRARALGAFGLAARNPVAAGHKERLRGIIAATESRIDLEPVKVITLGAGLFCLAVSPDGTKVAGGDSHGALGAQVHLYTGGREYAHQVSDGLRTNANGIGSLSFSPNGRWLAIGSRGGKVLVWDTATPDTPPRELAPGHKKQVNGVGFSPDGMRLVSASADMTLAVWDTVTWGEVARHTFPKNQEPLAVDAIRGEDRLVLGNEQGGWTLNARSLQPAPTFVPDEGLNWGTKNQFVKCSPDGSTVALGHHNTVTLYSTRVLAAVGSLADPSSTTRQSHTGPLRGLSFDPSGTLLASGGGDNYLKVWDVPTGRLLLRVFHPGDDGVVPVFDPATGQLLVAADKRITWYRVVRPESVRVFAPQWTLEGGGAVAFTGTGASVATAVWQQIPGAESWLGDVAVWDASTGRLRTRFDLGRPDSNGRRRPSVTAVPGGTAIVSGGSAGPDFQVWDWEAGPAPEPVSLPKPQVGVNAFLRFAPDGKALWGIQSGKKIDTVRCISWPDRKDILDKADVVNGLVANRTALTCLDVGRTWAAVGSSDCTVKLIRTADPNAAWQLLPTGMDNPVHSVALSPDESLVLAGTRSGEVVAFRLPGGERIDAPVRHHDRVEAVAFAPDGRLLATGGRDGTVRLWERKGETFLPLVTYPAAGPVTQLVFSPDGSRLAFVVDGQRAFNVWDLARFRARLKEYGLEW